MRLSRSRIGVVVPFGAMTLTLTALAFPAMLGLDKADGKPGPGHRQHQVRAAHRGRP